MRLISHIAATVAGLIDSSTPRAHYPYETVDGWMRELNEKIAADIRREEEAARRHMEFLCSLSHLVEE